MPSGRISSAPRAFPWRSLRNGSFRHGIVPENTDERKKERGRPAVWQDGLVFVTKTSVPRICTTETAASSGPPLDMPGGKLMPAPSCTTFPHAPGRNKYFVAFPQSPPAPGQERTSRDARATVPSVPISPSRKHPHSGATIVGKHDERLPKTDIRHTETDDRGRNEPLPSARFPAGYSDRETTLRRSPKLFRPRNQTPHRNGTKKRECPRRHGHPLSDNHILYTPYSSDRRPRPTLPTGFRLSAAIRKVVASASLRAYESIRSRATYTQPCASMALATFMKPAILAPLT